MNESVLCVGDPACGPSLASAFRVETARDGNAALAALWDRGPFAVLVSDLRAPAAVQLLAVARERFPDTARVLIADRADLDRAVPALNDGTALRVLVRPHAAEALSAAVAAGVEQYRLVTGARKRVAENAEWYRKLFDSNPHPMWVYDAETYQFLAVNDAAVWHYGYPRDAFLNMTLGDIALDDRGTECPHGRLYRHRHASGEVAQVEAAANPIEFSGRPAYLVLLVDVTERKMLEEQLRQAQKLESIGQLAAGVAHEINTPIQYIGDNTNFLADSFRDLSRVLVQYRAAADPARRDEADRAAAEVDLDYLLAEVPRAVGQTLDGVGHVARIVKAMKEVSHPGTGQKTPVDLNRAVETVIAVARNEWKYAAAVVTDLDPELPPVPGLPGELNQVFLNLLVNAAHAVQAAGRGRGTITISTRRADGAAEVRVADTGCGIPEEIRHRVFDLFFTTKPVGQGTGQGLAIAHAVVQRHGGVLALESEVGRGTTFTVRLPTGERLKASQRVAAAATRRVLPG